jgi:hypothetical protein
MKFYKYKTVQRLTFFGYDDILKTDITSFSKTSPTTVNVDYDTKRLRFDINKIASIQLSQNARIVLESIVLPSPFEDDVDYHGPVTVRMNNLSSNSYDSENKGYNTTLIYTTNNTREQFTNTSNELFYNFSIDQNFFKNGYIDLQITYLNIQMINAYEDFIDIILPKFYISFVVYDINEEELLLKDTPDVDYNNFRAHYNLHNGRIPK